MRPPEHDPPRWSEETATAGGGAQPAGAAIATAFRREPATTLDDTALARIGRTVMASAQPRRRRRSFALRSAILAALVVLATGGAVTAARLLWSPHPQAPQRLAVAAHNSVVVTGRHHRRLTLAGPATLTLEPDDRTSPADLVLDSGALTVEAGGEALSIRAGELTVTVAADTAGEIRAAGDGNDATVRALSGQLRLHRVGSADVTVSPAAAAETVPAAATAKSLSLLSLAAPSVIAANAAPAPAPQPPNLPTPTATSRRRDDVASASPPKPARVVAAPAPGFKPAPPAAPAEATLLAVAFRKLRGDRDAAGAVIALDDYDRTYPSGWLHSEATLARAEAMLALGRPTDALPLLESAASVDGTLTRNARVARGELLAKADRCARAVEDFSDVLLTNQADALAERALSGRAACLLRSGHADEARADLQRYLGLFPQGPRATETRLWLATPQKSTAK